MSDTKILDREQLLAAGAELHSEIVNVPELGAALIVREMTGTERDSWEAAVVDTSGPDPKMNMENARAKLLVRTIVDENGKRMFRDDEIDLVGALSATVLDRLYAVAAHLSRITPADLEELAGNFPAGRSGASGSRLPENSA